MENLIKMFKQKKIGQLSVGNDISIPLNSEYLITFFKDRDKKTIKEYGYLLNEKQSTLDNYVQHLYTACDLAKLNRLQVIEIVQNNKRI